MTIDNKKKTDRNGDCESVHAAGLGCIHVSSLYHIDDDLSSALSPMTGVALDGSLTLMGLDISHLPLLARKAIAKLFLYEHQM
nr:MAG TPA: hypothetical protein [Caudoviricetes sp.]DAO49777.1 MAG TPA: hypothetical protein [Caudoviricetes sp.]